jgi:hypothetical protein
MLFRYYGMNEDVGLDLVSEIDFSGTFAEVKLAVERHFEDMIATFGVRQVLVLTTSLGEAPGLIVAAEAVYVAHLNGRVKPESQARSLVWLIEDSVPKH